MSTAPSVATEAILVKSEEMPEGSVEVKGYDFNQGVDYKKLFESYSRSGFQATSVGNAITEINRMVRALYSSPPLIVSFILHAASDLLYSNVLWKTYILKRLS